MKAYLIVIYHSLRLFTWQTASSPESLMTTTQNHLFTIYTNPAISFFSRPTYGIILLICIDFLKRKIAASGISVFEVNFYCSRILRKNEMGLSRL